MSINRTVLVGRLVKDPELRYTPSGVAMARFTLAVNRTFSNQQGEREADFINCVVWRKQAENAANFLKKGNLAGVEGRIQTGSFEGQDGKRVYTTDVVCDSVQFLEPKKSGQESAPPTNNSNSFTGSGQQFSNNQQQDNSRQSFAGGTSGNQNQDYRNPYDNGPIEVSDDDLPF